LWISRIHLVNLKIETKINMAKQTTVFAQSTRITFGLFVIILGFLMYSQRMGWLPLDFPVWPVVLVGFGVFIIAGELSKR